MYSVCAERFLDTLAKVYAGAFAEGDAGRARPLASAAVHRPGDLLMPVCDIFKSACVWRSESWTGGYLDGRTTRTARR